MALFELKLAETPDATPIAGRETPALLIGRLYEQHYRMIRALCRLLLKDSVDAEDAAQQTFLSAFGSMIGGTVPASPAPWLATIARRECWARSAQRRRRPLSLDETNAPVSVADHPLEEAIRNADLAALWSAINSLPRQQRSVFLMREFSGLSYAEVAHALGASESAIESLLVRARRQLRDGLESAVSTVNVLATPVLLLQHRLARLLGERRAAAAGTVASAGIPVAAKLGAVAAGAIAVGAAGMGVGVGTAAFGHGGSAPLADRPQIVAASSLAGTSELELLTGPTAPRQRSFFEEGWYPLAGGTSEALSLTGNGGGAAPEDPLSPAASPPQDPSASSPTDPQPTDVASPAGAPADPSEVVTPVDPAATDPTPVDPNPVDPNPVDSNPVDPNPVDPNPVDPTPVDPNPVDPNPVDPNPVDPSPVDPSPGDAAAPATSPTDTPPADTSSSDTALIDPNA